MALPSAASKANCDSSTDDPKLAILTDLAGLIDKFNLLLSEVQPIDAQLTTLSGITAQQATDLAAVSTFMGTVLNDADAATARTTLGLDTIGQAEAEAGTATTARAWTAQRVAQAIAALSIGGAAASNPVRALATTYYNTAGTPRYVFIAAYSTAGPIQFAVSINGGASLNIGQTPSANAYGSCAFIVPPGESYAVTLASGVLGNWTESN